jgi:hypothetical protein
MAAMEQAESEFNAETQRTQRKRRENERGGERRKAAFCSEPMGFRRVFTAPG